jgi:hypothetical protein
MIFIPGVIGYSDFPGFGEKPVQPFCTLTMNT